MFPFDALHQSYADLHLQPMQTQLNVKNIKKQDNIQQTAQTKQTINKTYTHGNTTLHTLYIRLNFMAAN